MTESTESKTHNQVETITEKEQYNSLTVQRNGKKEEGIEGIKEREKEPPRRQPSKNPQTLDREKRYAEMEGKEKEQARAKTILEHKSLISPIDSRHLIDASNHSYTPKKCKTVYL